MRVCAGAAAAGSGLAVSGSVTAEEDNGDDEDESEPWYETAQEYPWGSPIHVSGWLYETATRMASDPPSDGLSAEALETDVRSTLHSRKSDNASTFVDNREILRGVDHVAYAEAKIAAIEELNDGSSQSECEDAGTTALDEYETTIRRNAHENWNESIHELMNQYEVIDEHEDASLTSIMYIGHDGDNISTEWGYREEEWEYPDGTTDTLLVLEVECEITAGDSEETTTLDWSPEHDQEEETIDAYDSGADYTFDNEADVWAEVQVFDEDDSYNDEPEFTYLVEEEWRDLFEEMSENFGNVRDGFILWLDSVYGDVQSGDITVDDLLTPREQAELLSDDERYPQAIADLMALNVPVDPDREATIEIDEYNATLRGTFGFTGDTTFSAGEIYDPADLDGDVFFTYDVTESEGVWTAYEQGIDGGEVTFTEQPYEDILYLIETNQDEVAEVTRDDFEFTDDQEWVVDISDQLEEQIAEIDSVEYYTEAEDTHMETIRITDTFEIKKLEDADGEEVDETEFSQTEPQDDDNYITEEEWEEEQERYEELIAAYEDATAGGDPILGGGWGDWFDDFEVDASAYGGIAVAILLVLALYQAALSMLPGN
ncbi:hypothetical protein RH858_08095 [Halalkaliarchaeum sp. AArc-GB]|uniref:hypothetical protein n=1 Tax=Halalkaliarchaeum sp. AArc-GB TaxID=3074078 RepID=UPI002862412B|nr:hypothetical protein [Halalkaliarchaeum sp. AArc-GB]MDR5673109.1 hypothetical protein [Halalkaliarchaeum sp. AArc-GB]